MNYFLSLRGNFSVLRNFDTFKISDAQLYGNFYGIFGWKHECDDYFFFTFEVGKSVPAMII
jgi:hypothetical protein